LIRRALPWSIRSVAVGAPPKWEISELLQARIAFDHATQANEPTLGRILVQATTEELPCLIVVIMRYAQNRPPSLEYMGAGVGGLVVGAREASCLPAGIAM
jgi:hypothetical protein